MPSEPFPVTLPLQQTLVPCPQCQQMTLVLVYVFATKEGPPRWEPLAQPLMPVSGEPHECP